MNPNNNTETSMLDRAIEFAKQRGFETAEWLKKWHGYDVYEPIMTAGKVSHIGLPLVILIKDDEIRMSTSEEAMQILNITISKCIKILLRCKLGVLTVIITVF